MQRTQPSRRRRDQRLLLAITALASIVLAARSAGGEPRYSLTGTVRDLRQAHPDFGLAAPLGHVAGCVDETLGGDGSPIFAPGGYDVVTQWTTAAGTPIAPHLYRRLPESGGCAVTPGVAVEAFVILNDRCVIDSFDSTLGRYGGGNVGQDALVTTNSSAPRQVVLAGGSSILGSLRCGPGGNPRASVVLLPGSEITGVLDTLPTAVLMPASPSTDGPGPSLGDMIIGAGVTVLDRSMHVDQLALGPGSTLRIEGEVTILCDGDLELDRAVVEVDGTLDLVVAGRIDVEQSAVNQASGDPSRTRVHALGVEPISVIGPRSEVVARIAAPYASLSVDQGAEVFGTFHGLGLKLLARSAFHVDESWQGAAPEDVAGVAGMPSDGAVSSAESFGEWFRDELGVNSSHFHEIELRRNDGGEYEHLDDAFFPIDGRLYGNEGADHNYGFTFAVEARFVYRACGGMFIEVEGGDGLWLFINGQLAIDLGGLASDATQRIELDRLALADGATCTVDLFYAQRTIQTPRFHVRTNVDMWTDDAPGITAATD